MVYVWHQKMMGHIAEMWWPRGGECSDNVSVRKAISTSVLCLCARLVCLSFSGFIVSLALYKLPIASLLCLIVCFVSALVVALIVCDQGLLCCFPSCVSSVFTTKPIINIFWDIAVAARSAYGLLQLCALLLVSPQSVDPCQLLYDIDPDFASISLIELLPHQIASLLDPNHPTLLDPNHHSLPSPQRRLNGGEPQRQTAAALLHYTDEHSNAVSDLNSVASLSAALRFPKALSQTHDVDSDTTRQRRVVDNALWHAFMRRHNRIHALWPQSDNSAAGESVSGSLDAPPNSAADEGQLCWKAGDDILVSSGSWSTESDDVLTVASSCNSLLPPNIPQASSIFHQSARCSSHPQNLSRSPCPESRAAHAVGECMHRIANGAVESSKVNGQQPLQDTVIVSAWSILRSATWVAISGLSNLNILEADSRFASSSALATTEPSNCRPQYSHVADGRVESDFDSSRASQKDQSKVSCAITITSCMACFS